MGKNKILDYEQVEERLKTILSNSNGIIKQQPNLATTILLAMVKKKL